MLSGTKIALVPWTVLVLALSAPALILGGAQQSQKAREAQLDEYKNLALASPPAPAADALLRLAAVATAESASWRGSLIEQAFELATAVSTETPSKPVPIGFTDSVPATTSISSKLLKVDRLSLQVRAAEAMLDIDRNRALEMFDSILLVAFHPLSCKALVVPDTSYYYEAVRVFSDHCFGNNPADRERRRSFLTVRIASLSSSTQVFPSIRLLTDVQVLPQDREALLSILSSSISSIRDDDDRSFTSAFLDEEGTQQLRALVLKCRNEGIDPTSLVSSIGRFYANHLSATRCSDTATNNILTKRSEHAITLFNALVREYSTATLTLSEHPSSQKLEDSAVAKDLWQQSSPHSELVNQLSTLSADPNQLTTEHKARLSQLITSIDSWGQPDNLDSLEFFILKAQLLHQVLQISRDADTFQNAVDANVRLFERSTGEQLLQPAVWIRSVTSVLSYAQSRGGNAPELARREFEKSSEPALHLYAGLDRRVSNLGHSNAPRSN